MAALLVATGSGCRVAESDGDGDPSLWRGSISEADGTATVHNTGGSVWGGTARLIQEASIGIEDGADEYLLPDVRSIWGDGDKMVVVDRKLPAVRAYSWDGTFLQGVGDVGEGPGEYTLPFFIGGDATGRIFLHDAGRDRMLLYGSDLTWLTSWPAIGSGCCLLPMTVTLDGTVYLEARPDRSRLRELGPLRPALRFRDDGSGAERMEPPHYEVPQHTMQLGGREMPTIHSPRTVWRFGRNHEVISGASHEYHFEIRRADGSHWVIRRDVELPRIDGEIRDWLRRVHIAGARQFEPGWNWDGDSLPDALPAFTDFLTDSSERTWVIRYAGHHRTATCREKDDLNDETGILDGDCWNPSPTIDGFAKDGRFLGQIELPEGMAFHFARPWIEGDSLIATVYDELDNVRVVRYRIVYPTRRAN